jgi:hypothetical protein
MKQAEVEERLRDVDVMYVEYGRDGQMCSPRHVPPFDSGNEGLTHGRYAAQ